MVDLTDYVDFYCARGYYDVIKEGKTLEEARKILGERWAQGVKEFTRLPGSKKSAKRKIRPRVAAKGRT